MNDGLEKAIGFACQGTDEKDRLKETLQSIALYGLKNSGFLDSAAFYGGTALRMFHGLDRFSEDLDFSLRIRVNPCK